MGRVKESTGDTQAPEWLRPYIQDYFGQAQQVADKPYEAYGGERVAGINPTLEAGLNLQEQQALQGDPAVSQYQATLGGDYLNSNPFLDKTFRRASQNVVDQYQTAIAPQTAAMASRAGAFGGSAYNELAGRQAGELGDTLGNLATDIYGGNYQAERGRQFGALQMAPTFRELGTANTLTDIGEQRRGLEQQFLTDQYQEFQRQQEHPYRQLDVLGSAISAGTPAAGQKTTTRQTKGEF